MPRAGYRSLPAVAGFLTLGLLTILLVPLHITVTPVVSESYLFGYNNHAALVLFLLFAAVFAVWMGDTPLLSPSRPDAGTRILRSRRPLMIALAITVALTGGLAFLTHHTPGINESGYFLDRLGEMGAGRVPYRQFEFAYGPLFLYLPLGLMRAFHLFLPDSYLLAWLAEWIAGVFVLWGTVQVAASLSPHRNSIFIVLFATSIPVVVTLGENYTALRLFALPGAAMATWTVWQRSCSARLSALTALVAMAGLLAISPELAVAFALATGTFLLIGLAAAKDRCRHSVSSSSALCCFWPWRPGRVFFSPCFPSHREATTCLCCRAPAFSLCSVLCWQLDVSGLAPFGRVPLAVLSRTWSLHPCSVFRPALDDATAVTCINRRPGLFLLHSQPFRSRLEPGGGARACSFSLPSFPCRSRSTSPTASSPFLSR